MTRKRKKILIIAGGCLAFYFVAVFFGVSAVVTRLAPAKLEAFLGRPVAVEKIRVNPLTLSVTVRGLVIKDKNRTDPFVRFDRLYVNAELWSLVRRGLVLKQVRLEKPEIHVARLSGTTFNFSDLMAGKDEEHPAEPETPSKPFRFYVADTAVVDGTVVYRDEPVGKTHRVSPINWHLPFISNFTRYQDRFAEPDFSCTVDGALVSLNVRTKPFKDTLETVAELSLSNLSLSDYFGYVPPDRVGFLVDRGKLDVSAGVSFHEADGKPVASVRGRMVLKDLNLTDKAGSDLLTLPRLEADLLPSVITDNRVHTGAVKVTAPALAVVRQADGVINLANLVNGKGTPATDEGGTDEPAAGVDAVAIDQPESAGGQDQGAGAAATEAAAANGFVMDVDRFAMAGGTIRFIDFAAAGPDGGPVENTINNLDVTVAPFTTAPEKKSRFNISAAVNGRAPVNIKGQMVAAPLAVEGDISLSEAALAWGQPYLPKNVKLVINGGQAAASGHFSLSTDADGRIAATVTADAQVRDLDTADPEKNEPFLQWAGFTVGGVKVSYAPLRVDVDTIAFKDLRQQVVVFEDGVTNIARIFGSQEPPAEPSKEEQRAAPTPAPEKTETPESPEPPPAVTPVRIGQFLMDNSEFRFTDRSLTPYYDTRLALSELKVTGLTSEDFKAADVMAKGTIDGYAPVTVSGTINPLAGDLFVNLDVKLDNLEMAPFSSYTGKYVGRAVEKGKLNLDLAYNIKQKALHADHHIVLDQFTLGKTIDSPDARDLPVGLAVALLKDRKGMIDVNLPVSGRTDDPAFKVTRIVFKALGNLIMKAATSPFSLVSALVGGGEEMRFIEFSPGRARLSETDTAKLDGVRKLMVERPGLKLEITGYADADADRQGLAAAALERRIKAPFLAASAKNAQTGDDRALDSVTLTPEQYQKVLVRLYKDGVEKNPVDGEAIKKTGDPTLTKAEMEAALVSRLAADITDADMGLLAKERAGRVKDFLLTDGAITADRVFLKAPDNLFKKPEGGFAASRVELGVK